MFCTYANLDRRWWEDLPSKAEWASFYAKSDIHSDAHNRCVFWTQVHAARQRLESDPALAARIRNTYGDVDPRFLPDILDESSVNTIRDLLRRQHDRERNYSKYRRQADKDHGILETLRLRWQTEDDDRRLQQDRHLEEQEEQRQREAAESDARWQDMPGFNLATGLLMMDEMFDEAGNANGTDPSTDLFEEGLHTDMDRALHNEYDLGLGNDPWF